MKNFPQQSTNKNVENSLGMTWKKIYRMGGRAVHTKITIMQGRRNDK